MAGTGTPTWLDTFFGGGSVTVQFKAVPLPTRPAINFIGTGLTVADNSGNNSSDVTVPTGRIPTVAGASGATLRNTLGTSGISVLVDGYRAANDGGGGVFMWDVSSSTGDDGGTIIVPTGSSSGRWRRVFHGGVDIRWFGADPTGVIDSTTAIQAAFDYRGQSVDAWPAGPVIGVPTGRFKITNSNGGTNGALILKKSARVIGQTGTAVFFTASTSGTMMLIEAADGDPVGAEASQVKGIYFIGPATGTMSGLIVHAQFCDVQDCQFSSFNAGWGLAFESRESTTTHINNGGTAYGANFGTATNNTFIAITGTGTGSAVTGIGIGVYGGNANFVQLKNCFGANVRQLIDFNGNFPMAIGCYNESGTYFARMQVSGCIFLGCGSDGPPFNEVDGTSYLVIQGLITGANSTVLAAPNSVNLKASDQGVNTPGSTSYLGFESKAMMLGEQIVGEGAPSGFVPSQNVNGADDWWHMWCYGTTALPLSGGPVAFAVSGNRTALPGRNLDAYGNFWLPNGYFVTPQFGLAMTDARYRGALKTANLPPIAGAHSVGDRYDVLDPTVQTYATGPMTGFNYVTWAYMCTTAGTPGTWKQLQCLVA